MADADDVEVGFSDDARERIHKLADHIVEDIATLYTLGDELGRGRFSVVQSAIHKAEMAKYAVKVVENKSLSDEENLEALETEIAILRKLDHPHIVSLKEVVVSLKDTYIVMELLSGGELFTRIVDQGPFPEAEAARLFAQILLSMDYLHSLSIVHRDVKPENILYLYQGNDKIKLIDFGYAGLWTEEKPLTGLCGTPDYVAPEVLTWYDDDDEKGKPYGKGSDLWSLGVLLYVILSGCSPFSADEEDAILSLVAQAKYEFHEAEWQHISPAAKDLISKLLVVEPEARLTMQQLLEHEWLTEAVGSARSAIEAQRLEPKTASAASSATPKAKVGGASRGAGAEPMGGDAAAAAKAPILEPTVQTVPKKNGMGCCLIS